MLAPSTSRTPIGRLSRRVRLGISRVEMTCYRWGLLDRSARPLPDLIGIGMMKAGTTWLYENLRCHPEIGMSDRKELRFFDANLHRGLGWYTSFFAGKEGAVLGEVSPGYSLLSRKRIELIHQLMPDARLVLLLRDPVEREWSALLHRLRSADRNPAEIGDDELRSLLDRSSLLNRGGYSGCIDRWTAVFGEEPLLIDFYERIARDPEGLLSTVFRHLGVDPQPDWDAFPLRKRIVPPSRREHRHLDRWRGVIVEGAAPAKHGLPASVREHLEERWADENRRLRARFGSELPWPVEEAPAPARR